MEKEPNKRPSVREILKMPLIRQKALEFKESGGLQRSKTMVFVKNIPKPIKKNVRIDSKPVIDEDPNMTPA